MGGHNAGPQWSRTGGKNEYIHQLINAPTSTNTHFPSLVLTNLQLEMENINSYKFLLSNMNYFLEIFFRERPKPKIQILFTVHTQICSVSNSLGN